MNHELGLQVLSQILSWNDDEARIEFKWLMFMSQYKYDGYRDYLAGARFIESLATWLQQFKKNDRRIAYDYIKNNLVYNSSAETQRLVDMFYTEFIQKHLVYKVSERLNIPKFKVWSTKESISEFRWELRKTLFMGLSDGAKTDDLRRANVGTISNEQIVASTQIDGTKWASLTKDLREDLEKKRPGHGENGKFSQIYLIDDFTASGTSLIRFNAGDNQYKGKLEKFYRSLENAKTELLEKYGDFLDDDWTLIVHHYIGTDKAKTAIEDRYQKVSDAGLKCFENVKFSYSMILPATIVLDKDSSEPFVTICKDYYDPIIENAHSEESGDKNMMFGYGQCSLPVVLEHNTPNNSLPLLWAETMGLDSHHAMRPLFRRRQRHTEFIE